MQKHHQKLALFSILAVALGSSLSWNPENTQIVRHYVPESGETMLASQSSDAAPDKTPPKKEEKIVEAQPEPSKEDAELKARIERLELEKKELSLRLENEQVKKTVKKKVKRTGDEDEVKFPTLAVSDECKALDDSMDDDDIDDEDDKPKSRVAERVRQGQSDNPRGEYLVCVKDQFVEEAQTCTKSANPDLTKSERAKCAKQVSRFFDKHIEPLLATDLKKGRDTAQFREALDMTADLIAEIPEVKGISQSTRERIRNKISRLTAEGAVSRGRDLMQDTIARLGDTPTSRSYALSQFREYVACEMNFRCNQMLLSQHGIPDSSFVGLVMNEAWLGGEHASKDGFMANYFNALMPYTKNGGPVELNGASSINANGGAPVAAGARGSLPQFQGTFKAVAAANGATPQWVGPQAPQRPTGQGGAPIFGGGPVQQGQGGAPYPQSRPGMNLPQQAPAPVQFK